MHAPVVVAAGAGRVSGLVSRFIGGGSGSTLPGVVAQRLRPMVLRDLAGRLPSGTLIVSATNGKTTTSRMLSGILCRMGHAPVHNRAGANLLSGLTAALVKDCTSLGMLRSDVGLFEVDEAALPRAVAQVAPRTLVLMNLFRDQLDRYGELQTIADAWAAAIARLPGETCLVLNADDPLIARLADVAPGRVLYFGVDDPTVGAGHREHTADSAFCRCGRALVYRHVFYGHLGLYRCPACGWERPTPSITAVTVDAQGLAGTRCTVDFAGTREVVQLALPGLYNVYNALAAAAAGVSVGASPRIVVAALEGFTTAFGRMERVRARGRDIVLWLVKNPTGFNESLRTWLANREPAALAIFINDKLADGLDVSWLWDVDFEALVERESALPWVLVGGTRAADMAVRLKYAGLDVSSLHVEPDHRQAIEMLVRQSPQALPVYCFATYTAMLELRRIMQRAGWVRPLSED